MKMVRRHVDLRPVVTERLWVRIKNEQVDTFKLVAKAVVKRQVTKLSVGRLSYVKDGDETIVRYAETFQSVIDETIEFTPKAQRWLDAGFKLDNAVKFHHEEVSLATAIQLSKLNEAA